MKTEVKLRAEEERFVWLSKLSWLDRNKDTQTSLYYYIQMWLSFLSSSVAAAGMEYGMEFAVSIAIFLYRHELLLLLLLQWMAYIA